MTYDALVARSPFVTQGHKAKLFTVLTPHTLKANSEGPNCMGDLVPPVNHCRRVVMTSDMMQFSHAPTLQSI